MKKTLLVITAFALSLCLLTSCYAPSQPSRPGNTAGNKPDNIFVKNHTVSLVVNNTISKALYVDDGDALTLNYEPTKDNHTFKGWYTDTNCTVPYDFSRPVTTSFYLYAGFSLTRKEISCQDVKIKALSSDYDNNESLYLSLVGFDFDYLEANGMGLQYTINYDVKYKKDYDVLFDIGYAGSPKYELSLINGDLKGYFERDLPTTKSARETVYTYNSPLIFSKDQRIELVFSTDNIQNIITFSDISVTIQAIRLK